jgi:hypothetical protein
MVMPTTASSARMMIWMTAKSTEVNRRHSARPARANGSTGLPAVEAARATAGVAMVTGPR